MSLPKYEKDAAPAKGGGGGGYWGLWWLMIVAEGMRLFPYIIIREGNGTYSLPIRRAISFTAKVMTSPA